MQDYWENRVQDKTLQDTTSRSWEAEGFNNHLCCLETYSVCSGTTQNLETLQMSYLTQLSFPAKYT